MNVDATSMEAVLLYWCYSTVSGHIILAGMLPVYCQGYITHIASPLLQYHYLRL